MHRTLLLAVPLLAALALVAGCETTSSTKPASAPTPTMPAPPPPIQEAPAPYRAQLHTEIAAGFYERGQMEVALQDLDGQALGLRRFTPVEYLGSLPASPLIAPGQSAIATLEILDPGKRAVAFNFDFH